MYVYMCSSAGSRAKAPTPLGTLSNLLLISEYAATSATCVTSCISHHLIFLLFLRTGAQRACDKGTSAHNMPCVQKKSLSNSYCSRSMTLVPEVTNVPRPREVVSMFHSKLPS